MIALLLSAVAAASPPAAGMVYFALVDRFADGMEDSAESIDPADLQAWHGGDLVGVQAHLPHLAEMGVSTLWLSPVFHSRQDKFHGHGAFHGYWVENLDGVEARFGGDDALVSLAEAAEAHGISLVLDMVYNHVSFDSEMLTTHPDWFHPPQTIVDWNDPVQLVTHQVHGLPDLAQENDAVYHYLLGRSLHWARLTDAAGIRVDAVRHLPPEFLHRISADLRSHQGADFWILGEDFQGDPVQLSQSMRDGGFDAMFDFPLRYAMVDVFCQDAHPGRLAGVLSLDRLYDNPHGLVTFLDNHDLPRIASECGGERRRVANALLWMFSVRGIPSITYGTEWLLTGAAEPENRESIDWSVEPVLAEGIAMLQQMRAAHPVLLDGIRVIEHLDEHQLRISKATPEETATIVINRGSQPIPPPDGVTAWLVSDESGFAQGTAEAPNVTPGGVGVFFSAGQARQHPTLVTVPITGGTGWLVGSGPELGNWNPDYGIELGPGAQVTLPAGTVVEWKHVTRDETGSVVWPEGANRYDRITAGVPLVVE